MFDRLKGLTSGVSLLRETRRLRREIQALHAATERIAVALEFHNAHQWPQVVPATEDTPAFSVEYVEEGVQAELMDIELRLTAARGQPPTEEEIFADYRIRHPEMD